MTAVQVVLLSVIVLCLVGNIVCVWLVTRVRSKDAPLRTGHRVTVHTKKPDDQTIFGVLVGDYADRIVLVDAEYVTPQGAQPLPGQQHVNVPDIAWMDVHAMVAPPQRGPVVAGPPKLESVK